MDITVPSDPDYLYNFWNKESTRTLLEEYHEYDDRDDLLPRQYKVLAIIKRILEERGVKL